jgi:hypothetical protein
MHGYFTGRFYVIGLAVILLSGCQSPAGLSSPGQAFYSAPAGTKLVLQRDITIPAGQVKIFFQQGRQVSAPDQYLPFCKFEILSLKDTPQVVRTDEFLIKRSGQVTSAIVQRDLNFTRPRFRLVDHPFDESSVLYGIVMFLQSSAQPDVYRMICGHLQDPTLGARGPTLEQIRSTLGDIFSLQLPQAG